MPQYTTEQIHRELEQQIARLSREDYEKIINLCKSIRQCEIRKEPNIDHCLDKEEVLGFVKDSLDYLHELSTERNVYNQERSESRNRDPFYLFSEGAQLFFSVVQDPESVPQKIQGFMSELNKTNSSQTFRLNNSILSDISLERQQQILAIVDFINLNNSKSQSLQQKTRSLKNLKKAVDTLKQDLSDFRQTLCSSPPHISQS